MGCCSFAASVWLFFKPVILGGAGNHGVGSKYPTWTFQLAFFWTVSGTSLRCGSQTGCWPQSSPRWGTCCDFVLDLGPRQTKRIPAQHVPWIHLSLQNYTHLPWCFYAVSNTSSRLYHSVGWRRSMYISASWSEYSHRFLPKTFVHIFPAFAFVWCTEVFCRVSLLCMDSK